MRRNLLKNISTSGGLLTADFIQSFQESDHKHDKTTPKSAVNIRLKSKVYRFIISSCENNHTIKIALVNASKVAIIIGVSLLFYGWLR